ncbi:biopolymer transporter ExbD [Pedobacter yulinensis]|uniref:Biopolymer transporter ExbD n=1 Tax=Pedobacter yulinensis TaxID=2126353 RepID=A0A2T3HQW3_9SPHI|nr:biopolymer transporter ExbD [Pedobacter yulinensis]PST84819.1 biopolymer transporter ExbD [Pedobacter yulinensis]
MPRVKIPRKSTAIDMTAMCDVAFLLLTFFILTATSRQPEPLEVTTPSSTIITKVPDADIALLTIGQGKVFFEVAGTKIRKRTLQLMGEKYGIKFTPQEEERFSVISSFGVPMGNLKQFINMDGEQRKKSGIQTGIPTDSVDNQLYNWIYQSRVAVKEIDNTDMRISIKGDAKEEYPAVRKIVDILQKQKMNKFSLITSAEGSPKE